MIATSPAWLAVVALALGTVPMGQQDKARTITASICGGGSITIALGENRDEQMPDCPKGACHAGLCRQPRVTSDKGARN